MFKRRKTDRRTDDFERAVSLCASVTDWMARQNYVVELFAAGAQILHLDAEPHSSHLDTILDVLAGVESAPTAPFVALAAALSQSHKSAPTTFCILLDWDEARRQFIGQLRRNGDWVKVVVVRDGATSLSVETEKELILIDQTQFQSGVNRL